MANSDDAPLGAPVEPLPSGVTPGRDALEGRVVRLAPVDVDLHGSDLYRSFAENDPNGRIWTYMPYGPFEDEAAFRRWLAGCEANRDPLFYAIIDREARAARGMASYLRITPAHGVIEIGHIWFSPALQNTRAATEALYLMMAHAFDDLGYRRLEWKCNALNAASRRAAERLGFTFEGIFRQHMVVKGRNRDSAWYSIIDGEWPILRRAYESWLADRNFDEEGWQRQSLTRLVESARQHFPPS